MHRSTAIVTGGVPAAPGATGVSGATGVPGVPAAVAAPRPPGIGNLARTLAPAARRQASHKPREIPDALAYDTAFRLSFLGAGQGGGRIADAFWGLGYRRVAAFNTTEADFAGLHEALPKLSLNVGGAGKDTQLAAEALRGRSEDVHDLLVRSWGTTTDCALICVSLGGGTGSGSAPELVRIARGYLESQGVPPRVGAIVSLPTTTEGYQICRNAVQGLHRLLEMRVSPLIVLDNGRINQLYQPPMSQMHATANSVVAELFHLFNRLAAVHSPHITFDRSELGQLLDSGLVVMGAGEVSPLDSPADVSQAVREQLTGGFLAQVDLASGDKAACLFVGSQDVLDQLGLEYFDAGFTSLDRVLAGDRGAAAQAILHRGLYLGEAPGLQAYVMVGGLAPPHARLQELARKGGLVGGSGTDSRLASFLGVSDAT